MPKLWLSPIFEKDSFPAENAGNMPEIANFVDFHWTFSLSFVISFVRSFVCSSACSFVRSHFCSRARSYFHNQVGPISVPTCLNLCLCLDFWITKLSLSCIQFPNGSCCGEKCFGFQ